MSSPLPFIYYGNWGAVFGFSLPSMRLAATLVGLAALAMLCRLFARTLPRYSFIAFALVVFNPYWLTMSVFAYTDMMGIFFLLLGVVATLERRAAFMGIAVAGALLSRQYLVWMLPPMAIVALLDWHAGDRRAIRGLIALLLGCVPLVCLVLAWGGLSPDNQMKALYTDNLLSYTPASLTLYVSLLGLYLFPLYWALGRPGISKRALTIGCGLALLSFVFPVRPSPSAIAGGFETVGLFDRFLHLIGLTTPIRNAIYWLGCWAGILSIWHMIRLTAQSPSPELRRASGLMLGLVLTFLAVMPLSYLHWEKYILPLLPIAAAGIPLALHAPAFLKNNQASQVLPAAKLSQKNRPHAVGQGLS